MLQEEFTAGIEGQIELDEDHFIQNIINNNSLKIVELLNEVRKTPFSDMKKLSDLEDEINLLFIEIYFFENEKNNKEETIPINFFCVIEDDFDKIKFIDLFNEFLNEFKINLDIFENAVNCFLKDSNFESLIIKLRDCYQASFIFYKK